MYEELPRKITRRTFLSTSCKLALGAAGFLAGSGGLFYYGAVQQAKRSGQANAELPGNIVKLGTFDRLNAISSVEKVDYEATIWDGWVEKSSKGFVYVTKGVDGDLLVISSVCTHLGCNVEPATIEQRGTSRDFFFRCPCHGAEFDQRGKAVKAVLQGLDTYEPIIAGGNVYVDIVAPIKPT